MAEQPSPEGRSSHLVGMELVATAPWLILSSVVWLAVYGLAGLTLLWVMGTVSGQNHAAAKALTILLMFCLCFLAVASTSTVFLFRAALSLRNVERHASNREIEVAIRQMGHYWTLSAIFWIVFYAGSLVAFFAAGLGAIFL